MKLEIRIIEEDGSVREGPFRMNFNERMLYGRDLKTILQQSYHVASDITECEFIRIQRGYREIIRDEEYIFEEPGYIELILFTSELVLKYVLVYPSGERRNGSARIPENGVCAWQLIEIVKSERQLRTGMYKIETLSLSDNGGYYSTFSGDFVFTYDSGPVYVYLTETGVREGMNGKDIFLSKLTSILSGRDWSILEGNSVPSGFLRIPVCRVGRGFQSDWPLWSMDIMKDIQGMVALPLNKVLKNSSEGADIIMVGVSGCGKSRTCYDFCRRDRFCLYMDWMNHKDLKKFINSLPLSATSERLNADSYDKYVARVEMHTKRLFVSRLAILKLKMESDATFTPDKFFQLQQNFFEGDFGFLQCAIELQASDVDLLFDQLSQWAASIGVRYVLDESHELLEVLKGDFHSSKNVSVDTMGQFLEPRSFLSFLDSFMSCKGMKTVWAGTHLRLRDVYLFNSARRDTSDWRKGSFLFTDFNFVSAHMISELLDKWVVISSPSLKKKIANELQGRPRLLMKLLVALSEWDGPVHDTNLEYIYNRVYQGLIETFVDMWNQASPKFIHDFARPTDRETENHAVITLLEDLIYNDCFSDTSTRGHAHWYRCLVSTSLVLLSEVDGALGLMCEPIVIKSGKIFGHRFLGRNFPTESILIRYMSMNSDSATRGKAIESLCVVRLREGFWMEAGIQAYLPGQLRQLLDRGDGPGIPIGIHDCRAGVDDHGPKLRDSFLNPSATHVVLSRERSSLADVVYSFFSFHVKTKWIDVSGRPLVVTSAMSEANERTIENTWLQDDRDGTIATRALTNPWLCVRFEFPTNAEMRRLGQTEMVVHEALRTTITASIDSNFTRLFFGDHIVARIKELTARNL